MAAFGRSVITVFAVGIIGGASALMSLPESQATRSSASVSDLPAAPCHKQDWMNADRACLKWAAPSPEAAKVETAKVEPAKTVPAKTETAKTETAKVETAKVEPNKIEPAKTEAPAKRTHVAGLETPNRVVTDVPEQPSRSVAAPAREEIVTEPQMLPQWAAKTPSVERPAPAPVEPRVAVVAPPATPAPVETRVVAVAPAITPAPVAATSTAPIVRADTAPMKIASSQQTSAKRSANTAKTAKPSSKAIPVRSYAADGSPRTIIVRPTSKQDHLYYAVRRQASVAGATIRQ